MPATLDPEALLCALVLAPDAYSRNKFFHLFESGVLARARRRAKRVRSVVHQLLGQGRMPAQVVGERILDDGRVLLRYRVDELAYQRTIALTSLEASALRYAMHRAGKGELRPDDRMAVESALAKLADALETVPARPRA